MKLLIPALLSFVVSSCPQPEELPRNLFSSLNPQAKAETETLDRTLARELHFLPGENQLSDLERNALDDFLLRTEAQERISELKVILWLPIDATAEQAELVRARQSHLTELLKAHRIPYEILMLESPFYEDSQGSLLAVLEP